jgi:hypothetical protein
VLREIRSQVAPNTSEQTLPNALAPSSYSLWTFARFLSPQRRAAWNVPGNRSKMFMPRQALTSAYSRSATREATSRSAQGPAQALLCGERRLYIQNSELSAPTGQGLESAHEDSLQGSRRDLSLSPQFRADEVRAAGETEEIWVGPRPNTPRSPSSSGPSSL